MQKIRRTKTIEGTKVPGFICNGGSYFFINVDVYEDGMVNCWELVDLDGLVHKLNSNWLVPSVPQGGAISIFGLGSYEVADAQWNFDQDQYINLIHDTVKQLNPSHSNIYRISEEEKELWETRKVLHSPTPEDFRVNHEIGYDTVAGQGFTAFMKHEGKNCLVRIVVYKDDVVVCYNSFFTYEYSIESVKELWDNKVLFTSFEEPTTIVIDRLGEVTFSTTQYANEINDKYDELQDMYKKLKGEKTSFDLCRQAYYAYLEDPSEFNRARLQEKYELVPEHQRMFLGDMDSRDSDYIRIIYYPDDKREV
ncbi:hypothetical protein O0555_06585 [Brevibacillus laterosporus]|uniref:DUF7638 domain-containing protein n=1 Tax=Brevibacillus laterosporus TaxID=1465 RepID=UPI0018CEE43D|nr:hypothetical protein [Brevibacillus laterosporus]MBG9798539.1 hypothetical protein [Brevibacillus laterosporus]MCR8937018.1 hypothetical protein [Brevibacillus laterosporus]MCZ0839656.1 hypothetical protein [Brevibacillus laterosporus]MCZ0844763.1 hypothetical protein [Brevibacillus laterosporus]MED1910367.1 hypothetical protein [Brevibacillus laterosporus]